MVGVIIASEGNREVASDQIFFYIVAATPQRMIVELAFESKH